MQDATPEAIAAAEAARLVALRDADDDWDPNAGKTAIEIGKQDGNQAAHFSRAKSCTLFARE